MCGLLGSLPAAEQHLFEKALKRLVHRGPDGIKTWQAEDKISLGHTRLAIIDTSEAAAQPLHYEHLTIVLNGEVYNYLTLRQELLNLGYAFRTASDTEVVAAAYLQWGANCVNKFNGMWALAIWDSKNEELFLCRDRFGKKPLFYTLSDNTLVFASEMKAIAPFLKNVEASPNFWWMADNIFAYEATDMCLIKDIKRFPAAHYAVYKNKKLSFHNYWNTFENLLDVPESYNEQCEMFRTLIFDACQLRLRSDVALGTSLSGGLDSSAITSVINHIGKGANPQQTLSYDAFTAYMPGTSSNESHYAASLCKTLAINHHLVPIKPEEALKNVFDDFYHFEELYHTPPFTMTETYKAFRTNGVFVSLDGHGADELFAGYRNFMFLSFLDTGFDTKKIKEITSTYNQTFSYKNAQHYKKEHVVPAYLKTFLWYHLLAHQIKPHAIPEKLRTEMIKKMGFLNYGLYVLFHFTILPTLLRNFDRYAMRHGVEVRMPFMDYRLVNFCFALPWHSKIKQGYTKAILRDALANVAPENILKRKEKMGYQAPLECWMDSEWKTFLKDEMSTTDFKNCSLINAQKVKVQTESFLNKPNKTFLEAEKIYSSWAPYFWEKGFLQKI